MQILTFLEATRIEVNSKALAVKYPIAQTISWQTAKNGQQNESHTCESDF